MFNDGKEKKVNEGTTEETVEILDDLSGMGFVTESDTSVDSKSIRKLMAEELDGKKYNGAKVKLFPKEEYGLAYDTIVMHKDGVALPILILATGAPYPTLSDGISKMEGMLQSLMSGVAITPDKVHYVPTDAIDDVLAATIKRGFGNNVVLAPNTVFPIKIKSDDKAKISAFTRYVYNVLHAHVSAKSGKIVDIKPAEQVEKGKAFYTGFVKSERTSAMATTLTGDINRCDWKVEISKNTGKNKGTKSLNTAELVTKETIVEGYTDLLVAASTEQENVNGVVVQKPVTRLLPHHIITGTRTRVPTLGYALLGLTSSMAAMSKLWMLSKLPINDKQPYAKRLDKVYKYIIGLNGDEATAKDKKVTPMCNNSIELDDRAFALKSITAGTAYVSVDIKVGSVEALPYADLMEAAGYSVDGEPLTAEEKQKATNKVYDTLKSIFKVNIADTTAPLFDGVRILPKLNLTLDNGSEVDGRYIDSTYVLSSMIANGEDPFVAVQGKFNKYLEYAASSCNTGMTGYDPYYAQLKIASDSNANGDITGKIVRLQLSTKFIAILTAIANTSVVKPSMQYEINFSTEQNQVQMINVNGASVQGFQWGAVNFGQQVQYGQQQNVFQTQQVITPGYYGY